MSSSVERNLGRFDLLAIMNLADMNTHAQVSVFPFTWAHTWLGHVIQHRFSFLCYRLPKYHEGLEFTVFPRK